MCGLHHELLAKNGRRIFSRRFLQKKNTERKKYRTSSEDTLRISPAVSYGRKKKHEVIEHILSVSVGKRGDLEITTKSYFTFFVRGENQKII